jgi:predicted negative regulator of RcsB-dependent stress response
VSAYTQQEELEKLKAWWKEYGNALIAGIALGAVVLFGYRYWVQQQEIQRETASSMYEQMLQQMRADQAQARTTGEKIIGEYASTPYAGLTALLLARQAYEAGDKALAQRQLEWAVGNAKGDATRHAARLRLARLHIETGNANAAATLAETKDAAGFESEYHELRGDLAVARGDKNAARTAYRDAMKTLPSQSYKSTLAMKLDDLGPEKQ